MKEQPEIKLFSALIHMSGPKGWSKHKFTILRLLTFATLYQLCFPCGRNVFI